MGETPQVPAKRRNARFRMLLLREPVRRLPASSGSALIADVCYVGHDACGAEQISIMANYAHGRSPAKSRCGPATSEVNKWLSAPKLCTQPVRAAFNPAQVNIDWRRALSSVLRTGCVCGRPINAIVTPETCAASWSWPAQRRSAPAL